MLETVKVPEPMVPLFEQAQAYVSRYFEQRRFEPTKGTIEVFDQRYILVRAASMSVEFFDQIIRLYEDKGEDEAVAVARSLLFDLAHAIGAGDARNFHTKMALEDPIEKLSAGPIHFAHAGWAYVDVLPESRPSPDEDYYLIYDHPYSFESDSWIKVRKKVDFPVCVMNSGYSSGWCEESFGVTLVATEILCKAKGDPCCRFIMAHPSRIEGFIKAYLQEQPELARKVTSYEVPGFFSRKQAEDELREREEQYRSVFEASTDALVVIGLDGLVKAANPAACMMYGYSEQDLIGTPFERLVASGSGEVFEQFKTSVANKGKFHLEAQGAKLEDEVFDIELRGTSFRYRRQQHLLAVIRDITLRKRDEDELHKAKEAAEAAAKAKSSFLANMSHEIRTPMNAVIGMTSLLEDTSLDRQQREFVETIRTSGEHLLGLINNILDFSKIEAGKLELEPQPVHLRSLIEDSLELVSLQAAEKNLELAYEMAEGVPEGLLVDPGRLRQILANLLANAVKFTEDGEVVVSASADKLDDGRHEATFSVRDTGIGVAEGAQEALFRPFTQLDASTTRLYGGTGLGLAISRRLAEAMGGRIWVSSNPEGGSTFSFTILAAEASVQLPTPEPPPELRGLKVLVVDDNSTNRRILILLLEKWGMIPRATGSPSEALSWLESEPFDLALLDFQMPEMDGLTLAERLREVRGRREMAFVLLTSMGSAADEIRSRGTKLDGMLTKPVKHSHLHDVLMEVMAKRPAWNARRKGLVFDPEMAARMPLRILVAEDNQINQKLVKLTLGKFGYKPDLAANGVEAVAAVERQAYDVVLMDVQMPEMDGCEATREIRRRYGDGPRIIAMTANALPGDRDVCLAAGMDDYLGKPISPAELAAALTRAAASSGSGSGDQSVQARASEARAGATAIERAGLERLLETLGEGGTELLPELIRDFLQEAPELIALARRRLQEGSAQEVQRMAHTLKSTGNTFGAARLANLCQQVEALAKAGRLEEAAGLLKRIEDEYQGVEVSLAQILSELEQGETKVQ